MHKFGWLTSCGNRALAAARLRFEIEIPIFEKGLLKPLPLEVLAIVSLDLSPALSANIVEMLSHPPKASRSPRDFDDHFRHAPDCPGDVRNVRLGGQRVPWLSTFIQR